MIFFYKKNSIVGKRAAEHLNIFPNIFLNILFECYIDHCRAYVCLNIRLFVHVYTFKRLQTYSCAYVHTICVHTHTEFVPVSVSVSVSVSMFVSIYVCACVSVFVSSRYAHVAVCCSVLQCVAVCCSVLQCVAVCCSVLQCVAVCCVRERVCVFEIRT